MKLSPDNTHVFIIRLWPETREIVHAEAQLRGTIEHVPGEDRASVRTVSDIISFMVPYLTQMGLKVALPWRMLARLDQRRRRARFTSWEDKRAI